MKSWSHKVRQHFKKWREPALNGHAKAIRDGITKFQNLPPPPGLSRVRMALVGQPLDRELLTLSELFVRSRKLYTLHRGSFVPELVSSPRTLGSAALLDEVIQYSPVAEELRWAATDPIQRKSPSHLLSIRNYCTSLYHEQNHRVLWHKLPAPPPKGAALRRYLNFAESLVIMLDMALGDELGPSLAGFFRLCGVIYDPGTEILRDLKSAREYRNYLQAVALASYLNLEMYSTEDVERATVALFPGLKQIARRAANRGVELDRAFVTRTNPIWQERHAREVFKKLGGRGPALELSANPLDNRAQYLMIESVLDLYGL